MKYAVDVGSRAMTYIQGFIKIGSDIQKLMGTGNTRHTDSMMIA
jgi:hypothetical protein